MKTAFPLPDGYKTIGLTKSDYMATAIFTAMISSPKFLDGKVDEFAKKAYEYAAKLEAAGSQKKDK